MSTTAEAAASLAALSGAGALPVLALVGPRWPALPLAPLAGSVMAAAAAMGCLAVNGSVLSWFVTLAVLGAAGSVLWWWRRPDSRPWQGPAPTPAAPSPWPSRLLGLAGVVAIVLATTWSLRPLRHPAYGFDTRAIYLLHAGWFADGHEVALGALRNPALIFSQQTCPLASAAVAVSWLVVGHRSDRLGVVVVALLNAAAVACAAFVVVEAGRQAARRIAAGARRVDGAAARLLGGAPALVGVLGAGLLVVAAFGVAGPYATDGYTDLLWSAAGVGALGYGLTCSGRGRDLGVAAVLLAVAGLTKDEGTVTAMVIVVLITARTLRGNQAARRGAGPWGPLALGLGGLAALAVWPLLVRALGATVVPSGTQPGSFDSRFHQTVSGMAPHLHPVAVAAAVSVVGALAARRARRATGLGNDALNWVVLAVYLFLLGRTYVTTTGTVAFRLLTSVDRTTVFPGIAAWYIVAVWAVVGLSAPGLSLSRSPSRRTPDIGRPGPDPVADAALVGVPTPSTAPAAAADVDPSPSLIAGPAGRGR